MTQIYFIQQECGDGDTHLHFFRTESEAMAYGQHQWDTMTDAVQERYRKNPHGYHRLSMGVIWAESDMDDDDLTDAIFSQDFGTELYDWTK